MTQTIPRALYIFIILGLIAFLAAMAIPFGVFGPIVPPLGKLGSVCGGPQLRPCKPGLVCSVSPLVWANRYGTCVSKPLGQ